MFPIASFRSKLALVLEGAFFVAAFGALGAGILAIQLRQPGERPADTPPAAAARVSLSELPPSITFIIMPSEDEAAALRTSFDEGNNVRFALGLSPTHEVVLVATDQQAALTLIAALEDGNRVLAAFGTEDRIVDATS
jgi:hypothetical protein